MAEKKPRWKPWKVNPLASPEERKKADGRSKWGKKLKRMSMEARGFE